MLSNACRCRCCCWRIARMMEGVVKEFLPSNILKRSGHYFQSMISWLKPKLPKTPRGNGKSFLTRLLWRGQSWPKNKLFENLRKNSGTKKNIFGHPGSYATQKRLGLRDKKWLFCLAKSEEKISLVCPPRLGRIFSPRPSSSGPIGPAPTAILAVLRARRTPTGPRPERSLWRRRRPCGPSAVLSLF